MPAVAHRHLHPPRQNSTFPYLTMLHLLLELLSCDFRLALIIYSVFLFLRVALGLIPVSVLLRRDVLNTAINVIHARRQFATQAAQDIYMNRRRDGDRKRDMIKKPEVKEEEG